MNQENAAEAILAAERRALDHWSNGDPVGYMEAAHEDVTYFDDIGALERVDGKEALHAYAEQIMELIPAHRYEIVDPRVQLYGDVGILTFRYHTSTLEGDPGPPWKATAVYVSTDDGWRPVHLHWSIVKDG
jgi:ketosteroid isomerase-like protein